LPPVTGRTASANGVVNGITVNNLVRNVALTWTAPTGVGADDIAGYVVQRYIWTPDILTPTFVAGHWDWVTISGATLLTTTTYTDPNPPLIPSQNNYSNISYQVITRVSATAASAVDGISTVSQTLTNPTLLIVNTSIPADTVSDNIALYYYDNFPTATTSYLLSGDSTGTSGGIRIAVLKASDGTDITPNQTSYPPLSGFAVTEPIVVAVRKSDPSGGSVNYTIRLTTPTFPTDNTAYVDTITAGGTKTYTVVVTGTAAAHTITWIGTSIESVDIMDSSNASILTPDASNETAVHTSPITTPSMAAGNYTILVTGNSSGGTYTIRWN